MTETIIEAPTRTDGAIECRLPVNSIKISPRFQVRRFLTASGQTAHLNPVTVAEYASGFSAEDDIPPVLVYVVDGEPILVDGFHRCEAAKRANGPDAYVDALLYEDRSEADAFQAAAVANVRHGLSLSATDKENAIEMYMRAMFAKSENETDTAIRARFHCRSETVARVRKNLIAELNIEPGGRTVTRNGTTFRQQPRPAAPSDFEVDLGDVFGEPTEEQSGAAPTRVDRMLAHVRAKSPAPAAVPAPTASAPRSATIVASGEIGVTLVLTWSELAPDGSAASGVATGSEIRDLPISVRRELLKVIGDPYS